MKMLYRILKITKTALKIIIRKLKKMNSVSFFVYFCSVKDGLHSDKMSTKKVLEKKPCMTLINWFHLRITLSFLVNLDN